MNPGLKQPPNPHDRAAGSPGRIERGVFVVELDFRHLKTAAPLGLVPQTILERAARVLLGDEELYRFRLVKLGECVQAHSWRARRP